MLVDAASWAVTALAGAVMITQTFGWDVSRAVAVLQALTPYLIVVLVPVACVALRRNRHLLAATSALVGLAGLVLALPIAFPSTAPADPDDPGLRIATVNLLFANDRTDEIAEVLVERRPDVIVFNEYAPAHQEVLVTSELVELLPHRVERIAPLAGGIAVWSAFPLRAEPGPATPRASLSVTIDESHTPVRVIAVHPPTPVAGYSRWHDDLVTIGAEVNRPRTVAEAYPTVIAGDFNATYWHPVFRDLLDLGFVDAHTALGKGLSTSWPTDKLIPAFVRLDHALVQEATLTPTAVEDFDVPGSDHRGFVVTVKRRR